jgi:hypothetical protein
MYNAKSQHMYDSISSARQLTHNEIDSLSILGILQMNNEKLFRIETCKFDRFELNVIIVLYRTNHAWYCKKYNKKPQSLDDFRDLNNYIDIIQLE